MDHSTSAPESAWGRLAVNETFQRVLRAEAQLENLNFRFPGILFSQRPDFTFAFVSPKIEELTGISAQEWRRNSRHFWEVVHESDAEPLMARLRNGIRFDTSREAGFATDEILVRAIERMTVGLMASKAVAVLQTDAS